MPAAWVAAVASVLGVASSVKANRETRKAQKVERRRNTISNRRERLKTMAQARQQRAEQIALGIQTGVSMGSGSASAIGSALSQTYSNIGVSNFLEASKNKQMSYMDKANQYANNAKLFQAASSVSSLVGSGTGNIAQDIGENYKKHGLNFSDYYS